MNNCYRKTTALIAGILLILSSADAQATFPGKIIAHGDASVSNESSDPGYVKVHDLVKEKKYSEAISILEEKAKTAPTKATPYLLKAMILNETGKYIEALSFFRAGYMIEQYHPTIHFGYCQIYRHLGKAEFSERACKIATEQHRARFEAHYEYAQILESLGKMEEALAELARAAELDPGNSRYHYERGDLLSYLNRNEDALKAFQDALSVNPADMDSAYRMAYIYAVSRKPDLAKKQIDRILDSKTDNAKAQSAKILLDYINKNALDKLPVKTVRHEYHVGRSQAFYRSGEYGLALLEIQTAAALQPDDAKIQEILVGLSSTLLRLDVAETAVSNLVRLSEKNQTAQARGYQELGDIKMMQGKLDEAIKNYEKAVSLGDPDSLAKNALQEFPSEPGTNLKAPIEDDELLVNPVEGLNRKGEAFSHFGMFKRAIAVYSAVLKMNPNHLGAMLNAAAAYYRSGESNRAISLLEKTLISHPTHKDIETHRLLLSQAYTKNGDLNAGLKNLEALIKINPNIKKTIESDPVFEKLRATDGYKKLFP